MCLPGCWCSPAICRFGIAPLPRFLDDGGFTKLLQAARADADPFVRLAVEFLARTGLRKGEFLDLTVDSVVQIGAAYWLHVPLGKLRSDRYIPLHPQLKELLDDWLSRRPAGLRSAYLFVEHGQRIGPGRVERAVDKAARAAGIGHVNPHRLRHTLATQAINRGMSLEAIAALLGHRSMRMTMVYARIANRTEAEEYFSVSEIVAKHSAAAAQRCPSLRTKHATPHALRHSCAMELLRSGVDTAVIALWLKHYVGDPVNYSRHGSASHSAFSAAAWA
jgi:integrase